MNPFKRRRQGLIQKKVEEVREELNGSGLNPEVHELLYLMFSEQRVTNGRLQWMMGAFTILVAVMLTHVFAT